MHSPIQRGQMWVGKVMQGGFEMGNVWYNEPNSLDTAFDVMGDIILSTAAQQYGGARFQKQIKFLLLMQKNHIGYIEKNMQMYVFILKKIMKLKLPIPPVLKNG